MPINEEWLRLMCGDCKHFSVSADRQESKCKRIDHKTIKFAIPWFQLYDCGEFKCSICNDFVPQERCVWLHKNWTKVEDFINVPTLNNSDTVALTLNNDTSLCYYVSSYDWFYGSFLNKDGTLRWLKKCYYRQSRKSPIGYELVWEYPQSAR